MSDKKEKALFVAINTTKIIKPIAWAIVAIGFAAFVVMMAPYVSGEQVLEEPLTNSQLTAIVVLLSLLVIIQHLIRSK